MSSLERYDILHKKQIDLKSIKYQLVQMGCSVKTLEQINHELVKVQNEINNLMWW